MIRRSDPVNGAFRRTQRTISPEPPTLDRLDHLDLDTARAGYASFDDADTPAEVDAVFRIQRRIAIAHFFVFISVTLGVGLALVGLKWAGESEVFGGFSPGFAMAAIGLYLFFVVVGIAAASLANAVEDRMMGARSLPPESQR